jgi:hypothetical protein
MFTIGYATKPIDIYVGQLRENGVNVVVDVRSVPYSRAFFDYLREALRDHLQGAGLRYVYPGTELGPRSPDSDHYGIDGQVRFDRLMQSDRFRSGIERLFDGVEKGFTIAISCACKDPAICHRSLLFGRALRHQHGLELHHILHDSGVERRGAAVPRLCVPAPRGRWPPSARARSQAVMIQTCDGAIITSLVLQFIKYCPGVLCFRCCLDCLAQRTRVAR